MKNIGIIGIGGVGGYLATKLSSYYELNENVRVHLYARGETAKALKTNGLILKSTLSEDICTKPYAVYEPTEESPIMDYLFVCVKSYSNDSIVELISRISNEKTIIVPFQNGVDGREKLVKAFPKHNIMDGCVYILSKIESPGVIINTSPAGVIKYFYGGYTSAENEQLKELNSILTSAFDEIFLVDNILEIVWSKFLRISTSASLQTYHNAFSGELLANAEFKEEFITLINEFTSVAQAMGHKFPSDIIEINLAYAEKIPYNATASMQRDFYEGKVAEIDGITGYIVYKANELGIDVPLYSKIYSTLLSSRKCDLNNK